MLPFVVRANFERSRFRLLNCTGGRDVLNFNGLSDGYASNHPGAYYRKRWTSGSLSIEAYHVAFDGLQHGPVLTYFCIPRYEGKRDISLLRVFPLSCARNSIPLRKSLLERGDKFLTLTEAIAHREYVGLTVVDHYSDDVAEQACILTPRYASTAEANELDRSTHK